MTVVTMASFGLTTVASAQTITYMGPDSVNRIDSTVRNKCVITNRNTVSVHNSNRQQATTGDATVSHNTTAGASWGGWAALDPAAAQSDGVSYSAWRDGVSNWMSNHSSGSGWNGSADNLTWAPNGSSWSSYDPLTWQANGQSFGNWWNGVQSYLDNGSSGWLLNWPKDATGSGSFGGGATSGNASNNNNSSFAIRINNGARALAGTNACGQSNFTPPPVSGGGGNVGGKGGGPSSVATTASAPQGGKGSVSSGGGAGGGNFVSGAPHNVGTTAGHPPVTHGGGNVPSSPGSSQPPSGGQGGGNVTPSASISNTGPGSQNTISSKVSNKTTVTNTNTVAVCNTSSQSASSGNATVSGNTSAGSGGSGYSSNGNGTGLGADLSN
jgi:hypothetical protein